MTLQRIEFSIDINAPKEKVWDILWKETYNDWAAEFSPGSRAVTDWQKGSKVYFVNSENEGMLSRISELVPNEYMSFTHLGMVNKGVEDVDSATAKEWSGAEETYTLSSINTGTRLKVETDITPEYREYMENAWPKALQRVKELAEK